MELNSKILLNEDGTYDIMVEEGKDTGVFLEATTEELKKMASAYAESSKKKKEVLKKEVEASKKIAKKAIVKAFLKKAIEKKRKAKKETFKSEFDEYNKILKIIGEASKKFDETAYGIGSPRFHRKDGDFVYPSDAKGDWYSKLLKEKLEEHDMNYGMGQLILEFWDEKFIGRYGRLMEDAFTDFEKVLIAIQKSGKRLLKGKTETLWFHEEDVEPPYHAYFNTEELERLLGNLFDSANMYFQDEVTFKDNEEGDDEDFDYDEQPYKSEIGVSLKLKPKAKLQ